MSRVLLATDGSELATRAARRATELFGTDHDFTGLVVVPPPATAVPVGEAGVAPMIDPSVTAEQTRALTDEAGVILERLAADLAVPVTSRIEHGDPGRTICELAGTDGYDAVVLGSHGAGFLRRLLIGSVSNHVLHHAPCPVLVVRQQET
jgi:nucleotide-binding universal stress UspA family protein